MGNVHALVSKSIFNALCYGSFTLLVVGKEIKHYLLSRSGVITEESHLDRLFMVLTETVLD